MVAVVAVDFVATDTLVAVVAAEVLGVAKVPTD